MRPERPIRSRRPERVHGQFTYLIVSGELEAIFKKCLQHEPHFWLAACSRGLPDHVESGGGQSLGTVDDLEVLNPVCHAKQKLERIIRNGHSA